MSQHRTPEQWADEVMRREQSPIGILASEYHAYLASLFRQAMTQQPSAPPEWAEEELRSLLAELKAMATAGPPLEDMREPTFTAEEHAVAARFFEALPNVPPSEPPQRNLLTDLQRMRERMGRSRPLQAGLTEAQANVLQALEQARSGTAVTFPEGALDRLAWLLSLTPEERAFVCAGLSDRTDFLAYLTLADYLEEHGRTKEGAATRSLLPPKGAVVVVTMPDAPEPGRKQATLEAMTEALRGAGLPNAVLVLPPDVDFTTASEEYMAKLGWAPANHSFCRCQYDPVSGEPTRLCAYHRDRERRAVAASLHTLMETAENASHAELVEVLVLLTDEVADAPAVRGQPIPRQLVEHAASIGFEVPGQVRWACVNHRIDTDPNWPQQVCLCQTEIGTLNVPFELQPHRFSQAQDGTTTHHFTGWLGRCERCGTVYWAWREDAP